MKQETMNSQKAQKIESEQIPQEVEEKIDWNKKTQEYLSKRRNKELRGQIAKTAIDTVASIVGVKGLYDVPAYLLQKIGVGKNKKEYKEILGDLGKEGISEKEMEEKKVREIIKLENIDAMEEKIDNMGASEEIKDKLMQELNSLVENYHEERKTLEAGRNEKLTDTLDEYIKTKISGVQATREALNTFFVASGAYGLRGASYGFMDGVDRYLRLKKQAKKKGEKIDIIKDVIAGGIKETWQEARLKDIKGAEKTKTQKGLSAVRAWGKIARYAGIGAMVKWHPETAGNSIDKALDALGGKVNLGDVVENYKGNIGRLAKFYGGIVKKPFSWYFGAEVEASEKDEIAKYAETNKRLGEMTPEEKARHAESIQDKLKERRLENITAVNQVEVETIKEPQLTEQVKAPESEIKAEVAEIVLEKFITDKHGYRWKLVMRASRTSRGGLYLTEKDGTEVFAVTKDGKNFVIDGSEDSLRGTPLADGTKFSIEEIDPLTAETELKGEVEAPKISAEEIEESKNYVSSLEKGEMSSKNIRERVNDILGKEEWQELNKKYPERKNFWPVRREVNAEVKKIAIGLEKLEQVREKGDNQEIRKLTIGLKTIEDDLKKKYDVDLKLPEEVKMPLVEVAPEVVAESDKISPPVEKAVETEKFEQIPPSVVEPPTKEPVEDAAEAITAEQAEAVKNTDIKIEGKIDTFSEAIYEATKQAASKTQDNFIHHVEKLLGKEPSAITDENRDELVRQAVRKLSVANIETGDKLDVKNLLHQGDVVRLKSTGDWEVIESSGIKAEAVSELQLRENWADIEGAKHGFTEEVSFAGDNKHLDMGSFNIKVDGVEVMIDDKGNFSGVIEDKEFSGNISEPEKGQTAKEVIEEKISEARKLGQEAGLREKRLTEFNEIKDKFNADSTLTMKQAQDRFGIDFSDNIQPGERAKLEFFISREPYGMTVAEAEKIFDLSQATGMDFNEPRFVHAYDNIPDEFKYGGDMTKAEGYLKIFLNDDSRKIEAGLKQLGIEGKYDPKNSIPGKKIVVKEVFGERRVTAMISSDNKIGFYESGKRRWGMKGLFRLSPNTDLTADNLAEMKSKITGLPKEVLDGGDVEKIAETEQAIPGIK